MYKLFWMIFMVSVASTYASYVAISLDTNEIFIWNWENGTLVKNMTGHTGDINCMKLLSDGRLATGSNDYTIKIWNLNTYSIDATINVEACNIDQLENGTLVVIEKGIIQFWSLTDGRFLNALKSRYHHTLIKYLGNNVLASADASGHVFIWDLNEFAIVRTINAHTSAVMDMKLMPDGNIATAAWDYKIKIWEPSTGVCLDSFTIDIKVNSIEIISNNFIAFGGHSNFMKIYRVDRRLTNLNVTRTIDVSDFVVDLKLQDNGFLLIALDNGNLAVYDLARSRYVSEQVVSRTSYIKKMENLEMLPIGGGLTFERMRFFKVPL